MQVVYACDNQKLCLDLEAARIICMEKFLILTLYIFTLTQVTQISSKMLSSVCNLSPDLSPVHTTPFLYKNVEENNPFCETVHSTSHNKPKNKVDFGNALEIGYLKRRRFAKTLST